MSSEDRYEDDVCYDAREPCSSGRAQRRSIHVRACRGPKDWRTDKYLRNLEAMLIVTDGKELLIITGAGDVLEPENNIAAVGSGGNFALAAARGLYENIDDAEKIAKESLKIASEICVFTNGNMVVESIVE